ncbi:membrane-bound PQQ-dependent dehydrogenase, glucose/quinate/shikimate family, partial [Acinetobacter baumannii]
MNQPSSRSGLTTFTVIIIVLLALFLLSGGICLAALGVSIDYIVAGFLLLIVALQLYNRASAAFWVYSALILVTIFSSVWEFGTDFW